VLKRGCKVSAGLLGRRETAIQCGSCCPEWFTPHEAELQSTANVRTASPGAEILASYFYADRKCAEPLIIPGPQLLPSRRCNECRRTSTAALTDREPC